MRTIFAVGCACDGMVCCGSWSRNVPVSKATCRFVAEELPVIALLRRVVLFFSNLVFTGRIQSAMLYLSPASSGGVLSMEDLVGGSDDKTVRDILWDKHPLPADPPDDVLLPGEPEPVNPIAFQRITPELIPKGRGIHGSSGPSGMDSDSWCRMLTCYKTSSTRLCSVLAAAARSLCIEAFESESMVGFTSARLIPLDKRPGQWERYPAGKTTREVTSIGLSPLLLSGPKTCTPPMSREQEVMEEVREHTQGMDPERQAVSEVRQLARSAKAAKIRHISERCQDIQEDLSSGQKFLLEIASEKRVSSWLNVLPQWRDGTVMAKSDFRDAIAFDTIIDYPIYRTHVFAERPSQLAMLLPAPLGVTPCFYLPHWGLHHAFTCPTGGYTMLLPAPLGVAPSHGIMMCEISLLAL